MINRGYKKFFSFRPFIDVLFCCLLMLVAILFLLKAEEEKVKMRPPNTLYEVVLTWAGESEDDLDLYVQAASGHVVSFNNREGGEGSLVSLNHDALGKSRNNSLSRDANGTVIGFNEEIVAFRGVVEGENIVTVHVYSKVDEKPIEATIVLIKVKPFKQIVMKKKILRETGDEKTAFRFRTDKNGKVIEINELPAILTNPLGE
jgi:biopolymer transport protein ExbD